MKTAVLAVVVFFFAVSGWTLAAQNTEQKQDPSMMEHMMKEGKDGEHMGGMMRMLKMMNQCATMMESAHGSEESKESTKK
jgi:hypothetical protein